MRTVLFLGSLLLLAACGSKGPLIPPPAKLAPAAGAVDHSTASGASR